MTLDNRSYDRSLEQLIAKATEYNSDWTKFDQADIGITIIKLLATQSHVVDYYTKYYLENLYLPSNRPEFIYEMLGYKPAAKYTTILSLRVDWLKCGPDDFIYFPKNTSIELDADGKKYNFLTTKEYYLRQYSSRVIMDMIHGELIKIKLKPEEIRDNKYLITEDDIDFDTVTFTVDDHPWSRVKNVFYEPKGCVFSVHLQDDDPAGSYVYLQDGWQDQVPSEVSEIVIEAIKIPEHFTTNTVKCIEVKFKDPILNAAEEDITENFALHLLDVTPVDSTDSQDLAKDRIITLDDFEFQSMMFPGVAAVRAYDWDTYHPSLGINRPFFVKVVATGPDGNLSAQVKSSMRRRLKSMTFDNIEVEVVDPVRVKYNPYILANIGQYKGTYQESDIYQSIRRGIERYFTVGNIEIGTKIDTRAMFAEIFKEDERIRYLEWYGFKEGIDLDPLAIPVLGTLTVDFNVDAELIFDVGYGDEIAHYGPVSEDSGTSAEDVTSIEVFQSREDTSSSDLEIAIISDKHLIARDSIITNRLDTMRVLSLGNTAEEEGSSLEVASIKKS
ncbi:baseplate protein [Bacillus phage SP-15]|uniref:Baseplate protein n=1 Tax=Bacillus phage SP-15 TaxID=1792032 RepID=A0A127AW44_9CAUD|nr:baseplate protein [Bacillus phage SP-15]AMM44855.1 baseplate protein [Bacillus phage SP-15]